MVQNLLLQQVLIGVLILLFLVIIDYRVTFHLGFLLTLVEVDCVLLGGDNLGDEAVSEDVLSLLGILLNSYQNTAFVVMEQAVRVFS